jgi:signal transducing adaptor molecule
MTTDEMLTWLLDDFTQLNEKFIKARRDYEALLESSMAHPPQHNYHQYAMRPAAPGQGYGAPGPSYPAQGAPPPQDAQRYYTPGPQGGLYPYTFQPASKSLTSV